MNLHMADPGFVSHCFQHCTCHKYSLWHKKIPQMMDGITVWISSQYLLTWTDISVYKRSVVESGAIVKVLRVDAIIPCQSAWSESWLHLQFNLSTNLRSGWLKYLGPAPYLENRTEIQDLVLGGMTTRVEMIGNTHLSPLPLPFKINWSYIN